MTYYTRLTSSTSTAVKKHFNVIKVMRCNEDKSEIDSTFRLSKQSQKEKYIHQQLNMFSRFFFILFFFIGRFVVCIVFRCALTQQIHLSSADRFTERRVDNLLCFQTKKKQKSIGLLHRFYLFNHSCGRSDDDDDATAGTKYRSSVERNKQNKTKKVTKVRIFSSSANLLEGKKKSNLF